MQTTIPESDNLASAVIDALPSHICVIDSRSMIVAVNRAWRNFAIENPPVSDHTGIGVNYLKICRDAAGPGSEGAEKFGEGIEAVLQGKTELFQMEYACHSPAHYRWFLGQVAPLKNKSGGAVISHTTITDRKLLEFELVKLAATDSLTGLPNRRYFFAAANLEVERVRRFHAAASLVMIDIDDFKAVNDSRGHAAGDDALHVFILTCKKLLRHIDVFARLGGDEFVIMLPGTNEAGAASVAEKLRDAVRQAPVGNGANPFNISASFGVAEIRASDPGIDACLTRADTALYAAKRAGRNCVKTFAASAPVLPRSGQVGQ